MKEEFMKRIDARKEIANYPFGAEEMLLYKELKTLNQSGKKVEGKKDEISSESYPFGAEEMLLNAELEELEI